MIACQIVDEMLQAIRLLNGFCVDSRNIIIKPDNSIQEKLESYQAMIPDTKRREQEHQDYLAKLELDKVFKERSGLFGGKQNHVDSWGDLVPDDVDQPTIESTDGVAVLRNNMIMSEIEKFRSNQDKERKHMEEKQREAVQARLRREKEEKEAKIVLEQKEAVSKQLDELAATSVSYPGKEDKEVEETQRRRRSSRERSYSPDRRRRKRYSRSRSRDRDRRRRRYDDDDDDHDRRRRRRSDERRESNPTSEKTKVVIGMKLQRTSSSTLRKETSHAAIFKVDEDAEMKPLRALVPLDYTEEEKLATAPLKDRVAASLATVSSRADGKKLKGEDYVKELIDNLPTSSKGLFAYHIDWLVVQQHEIVEKKMKPWIQKKIIEYLGEEEASLIEFIAAKLNNRARPDDIEFELKAILDSDAEIFMKLLWRKLIFESIRAKEGL